MADLAFRFLFGGIAVSAFALVGELFKPKTFSGLFGAAPSVALATLALGISKEGVALGRIECRSMLFGVVGLVAYGATCVWTARRKGLPVWLGAALAWLVWLAVTFAVRAGVRAFWPAQ